jgi:hypothetical protein
MRGAHGSAADGYALLADEAAAAPHIEALHQALRRSGIWLWTKGTIEKHLNLSAKNEAAWSLCLEEIKKNGLDAASGSDQKVIELFDWIAA